MRNISIICAALIITGVASTSSAQTVTPSARQGYYISTDAGAGVMSSTDDKVGSRIQAGQALSIAAGQSVTSWLDLGLRIEMSQAAGNRWTHSGGGLLFEAQFTPWRELSVGLGAGLGSMQATDGKQVFEGRGGGGALYGANLSYAFFPFYDEGSGGWAVSPHIGLRTMPGDSFRWHSMRAGVALTWWAGLPSAALDLPDDLAYVRP